VHAEIVLSSLVGVKVDAVAGYAVARWANPDSEPWSGAVPGHAESSAVYTTVQKYLRNFSESIFLPAWTPTAVNRRQ